MAATLPKKWREGLRMIKRNKKSMPIVERDNSDRLVVKTSSNAELDAQI